MPAPAQSNGRERPHTGHGASGGPLLGPPHAEGQSRWALLLFPWRSAETGRPPWGEGMGDLPKDSAPLALGSHLPSPHHTGPLSSFLITGKSTWLCCDPAPIRFALHNCIFFFLILDKYSSI